MPTPEFVSVPLDYTSRSYAEIRDSLVDIIPYLTEEWTDRNPSDPGMVQLQLMAYIADVLHYYIDRNAAEGFVDSAITQAAHDSMWRLIDYTPTGSAPSTVTLTFTAPAAATTNLVIPAQTQCDTASTGTDIISFETDEEAVITAGSTTTTVTATQGVTKATTASLESLGSSDGKIFQNFKIPNSPTIDSTIRVFVDEGGSTYYEYYVVSTFDTSEPTDRVFKLAKDEDGFSRILFGDGNTGKVPPSGGDVGVAYRVGGGVASNVGANTITVVADSLGFTVAVTNAAAASGGSSPDGIPQQKEKGPLSLKALNRAVTLDDYRSLSKQIEGVYDAYAYFHSPSSSVRLAIAPTGGGAPSAALKTTVQTTLDAVNCLGAEVEVVDAKIIPINITASITVQTNVSQADVKAAVDEAVEQFLSFGDTTSTSKFGTDIYLSDVTCLIDDISGVDHVDISKLTRTVVTDLENFADQNATITINTNTGNTVEQVISVKMDSDAAQQYDSDQTADFTVEGSVSGPLGSGTAATTSPTEFTGTGAGVDFDMTIQLASNSPVGPFDSFTFTIGKYLGNQTISEDEIADDGTLSLTYTGGI